MKNRSKLMRMAFLNVMQSARKRARRVIVRVPLRLSGADAKKRMMAERMLRGREGYEALRKADAVIVSYPKSGRTWLRVMISRLYQQVYDLPEDMLLGFDNFHHMDRLIPRVLFTHDEFIREYTGNLDNKADFHDKKVILLVRDPRDVAVSLFFHWRYRIQPWKKEMSGYPSHDAEVTLFDFVCNKAGGLPRVIDFMNVWAKEMGRVRDLELLRYEEMRAGALQTLGNVARFLEIPANADQMEEAVSYASYENMKKKEADRDFRMGGGRMVPRDRDNPDSYKVRRAKVGGYRDYFDDAQIEMIDRVVTETLDPIYGYGASETGDTGRSAGPML